MTYDVFEDRDYRIRKTVGGKDEGVSQREAHHYNEREGAERKETAPEGGSRWEYENIGHIQGLLGVESHTEGIMNGMRNYGIVRMNPEDDINTQNRKMRGCEMMREFTKTRWG